MPDIDTGHYLQVAQSIRPRLVRKTFLPVSRIKPRPDAKAWQGWAAQVVGEAAKVTGQSFDSGNSFVLDFGQHLVGRLGFAIAPVGAIMGAPVRLKFIFAETLSELAEPLDPSPGRLCRSWLQDEVVNVDWLPAEVKLPRRYAFRYVKVTVLACPEAVKFGSIACTAETSASFRTIAPAGKGAWRRDRQLRGIFDAAVRTLRGCMQTVFEDGPKRDRRLWLGDLRIGALCNAATFRNFELVRRCLYLFAALPFEDGMVSACVYDLPRPARGQNRLLDYAALFGPAVLDYARACDDWATAADLWPAVVRQAELLEQFVDADGLWDIDKGDRIFADWREGLHKQATAQAIMIYSCKALVELSRRLDRAGDIPRVSGLIERMSSAARERLYDAAGGLFVSGPERQVSYSSNAWMVLAGVVSGAEAAGMLTRLTVHADAVLPATPYMHHHFVEALLAAGMKDAAVEQIRRHWGGMLELGADTYWEMFDATNHRLSAYKDHHLNSYCHAWSCGPAYFLTKYMA